MVLFTEGGMQRGMVGVRGEGSRIGWLVGVLTTTVVAIWTPVAGSSPKRQEPKPVLLAYGSEGEDRYANGDGTYDIWSPDHRFVARWRIEMPNTTELTILDGRTRRAVVHLPEMNDFLWVPHQPHRLVAAGGGPFGHGFLWMWEGGRRWRSLVPVRRPKEENFVLFGVTRDGQFLIYGHGPSGDLESYDAPHLRQWLRLPPTASSQRAVSMAPVRQRLYWVARYMGDGADLHGVALPGAELAGADLEGANFTRTNLAGANLSWAKMGGAHLEGANLHGARMVGADLRGTSLAGAELTGADLTKATLDKNGFEPAELTGARYDARTRWPKGFDPRQHGALLVK
jgi:hypothetical protein